MGFTIFMASLLHYVECNFKRCLKSAAENQRSQNDEKDERFLEKHDIKTNNGEDSSSPLGSSRGHNNQSSASIWPNHLHPLTSSTDFLFFLAGLLPATCNLSILQLTFTQCPSSVHVYAFPLLLFAASKKNLNILAPPIVIFPQTPSKTQSSCYCSAHLFFHSCW